MKVGEPHHFDVSATFGFEFAGRADFVEVAVQVNFEQQRGFVRRRAGLVGPHMLEPEFFEIDVIRIGINDAHDVIRCDHFFERGGKKSELSAVFAGAVCHKRYV